METPAHCHNCGGAYPWKDKLQAIAAAKAAAQAEASTPKRKGKGSSASQNVFHGPVINNAGTITSSPIVQAGSNSTQSFATAEGAGAKEAIRIILEVLDELDLSSDDKNEVRSDAHTVLIQLESPKPKAGIIRSLLTNVRDKIISAVVGKASTYAVEKAQEAIQGIDAIQNLGG